MAPRPFVFQSVAWGDVAPAGCRQFDSTYEGVIPNLERRHKETDSDFMRRDIERFMRERPCHECHGKRLRPEVLAITVADKSIIDICELSIDNAVKLFDDMSLRPQDMHIAKQSLKRLKRGYLLCKMWD